MPLLKRLPIRRLELLFSVVLILGFCGLIRLAHQDASFSRALALLTLEMLLPLATGLVSAGLLAGDPALEILLTTHRPAWQVLAERIVLLFCVAAGLSVMVLTLAEKWALSLPKGPGDRAFIWLSPLVFCLGLANMAATLHGRALDGAIAVASAMGFSLLILLQIPLACAKVPAGKLCLWWLASPLMTLGNADSPIWPFNRLFWLGVGLGLLALSFVLTTREEALLQHAASE